MTKEEIREGKLNAFFGGIMLGIVLAILVVAVAGG